MYLWPKHLQLDVNSSTAARASWPANNVLHLEISNFSLVRCEKWLIKFLISNECQHDYPEFWYLFNLMKLISLQFMGYQRRFERPKSLQLLPLGIDWLVKMICSSKSWYVWITTGTTWLNPQLWQSSVQTTRSRNNWLRSFQARWLSRKWRDCCKGCIESTPPIKDSRMCMLISRWVHTHLIW